MMMSVRSEDGAPVNFKEAVVGKNREFQYHLVYFRVAVTADTEQFLLHWIQHGNNFLWIVILWQVITRTVIKDVSEKKKAVSTFTFVSVKHFTAVVSRAVDIGCNH